MSTQEPFFPLSFAIVLDILELSVHIFLSSAPYNYDSKKELKAIDPCDIIRVIDMP